MMSDVSFPTNWCHPFNFLPTGIPCVFVRLWRVMSRQLRDPVVIVPSNLTYVLMSLRKGRPLLTNRLSKVT